jgi:hypothetical protein
MAQSSRCACRQNKAADAAITTARHGCTPSASGCRGGKIACSWTFERDLHVWKQRAIEREQKEKQEAHEREIQYAKSAVGKWTRELQRLTEKIEKVKAQARSQTDANGARRCV